MGNKASMPANEAIYHAAKTGKAQELEAFLRSAPPESRPEDLLEWQDEDGRTPLIVAASKNHLSCITVLLQYRANVQHMSRRREGGSALHEAVYRQVNPRIIEALLQYGASPFVENVSRFTALDYAIVRRDATTARRLERCGYFCEYVQARVRKNFGITKAWVPKWVAIVPRYSCPLYQQQPIRRLLFAYNDARAYDPISRLYLDGSTVRQVVGNTGQPQLLLALHPTHVEPKFFATQKDGAGQWLVSFKQHRDSQLSALAQALNAQHEIPVRAFDGESDEAFARRVGGYSPSSPIQTQAAEPDTAPPAPLTSVHSAEAPVTTRRDEDVVSVKTDTHDDEYINASAPPIPQEFYSQAGSSEAASAPPVYSALGQDSVELADDELCVVCLDKPKSCGLVHGTSMHRCVCPECSRVLTASNNLCPICRQPIEHVITNFYY